MDTAFKWISEFSELVVENLFTTKGLLSLLGCAGAYLTTTYLIDYFRVKSKRAEYASAINDFM